MITLLLIANTLLYPLRLTTSNGSFPKPLSAKEERMYLERAAEGDLEARNILVERNLRLVAHILKKYYSASAAEQDDLISIGTIGLIKAISTFDGSKGARLATYAGRCIQNEILMYFRSQRKTTGDVSLSELIETGKEGGSLSLMDVLCSDEDMFEQAHIRSETQRLTRLFDRTLEDREKQILSSFCSDYPNIDVKRGAAGDLQKLCIQAGKAGSDEAPGRHGTGMSSEGLEAQIQLRRGFGVAPGPVGVVQRNGEMRRQIPQLVAGKSRADGSGLLKGIRHGIVDFPVDLQEVVGQKLPVEPGVVGHQGKGPQEAQEYRQDLPDPGTARHHPVRDARKPGDGIGNGFSRVHQGTEPLDDLSVQDLYGSDLRNAVGSGRKSGGFKIQADKALVSALFYIVHNALLAGGIQMMRQGLSFPESSSTQLSTEWPTMSPMASWV